MHKPDTGATNVLDRPRQAPKGIVDPVGAARRIRLATYPPCQPLQCFVDYFWLVEWNLDGRPPENQRVLPYPNAHLVFDRGRTAIHGVVRGPFDRTVEGAGRVIDQPLSRLADRTMPVDDVVKIAAYEAEQRVLGQDSDEAMVAAAESMLVASLPPADPRAILAEQAVNAAAAVNGPTSVGALAGQLGVEERSLQRLFSNYVGVSPKWVDPALSTSGSKLAPGPVRFSRSCFTGLSAWFF